MIAENIAQKWLDDCCRTIQQYDHAAHMDLISKDIQVFGVPGFDTIGYADWYSQCEYEFSEKLIENTSYQGLEIRQQNDSQIMFQTNETIRTSDGTVDSHAIEVVLTREPDGAWRVTRERLLSSEEATHFDIDSEER